MFRHWDHLARFSNQSKQKQTAIESSSAAIQQQHHYYHQEQQQHHEVQQQLPLLRSRQMHRHQRPRRLLRRILMSAVLFITLQNLPPLRTILRPRLRPHLDARPSAHPHRRLPPLRSTHLRRQSLHEGPPRHELPPLPSPMELLPLPLLLHRSTPHRTPTLPQSNLLPPPI